MYEIVPDEPDWDEYEVEQARIHRHNKRIATMYEREEIIREEEEIENAGN
jgi:hypothetical protein